MSDTKQTKPVDYFSAITWSPWIAGATDDEIVGEWAEDASRYTIKCPHQLRDLLIEIQNRLHSQFAEVMSLRNKLSEAESRSTL